MKLHFIALVFCLIYLFSDCYAQSCSCDHTISGLSTTAVNQIFSSSFTYSPGDTFCILSDSVAGLRFLGFEGTIDSPITIINCGGEVVVDEPQYSGISLRYCKYVELSGNGDPAVDYGFHVIGTGLGAMGVNLTHFDTDIEIHHTQIEGTGFAGIVAKTDPNCNDSTTWRSSGYIFKNLHIHHNYIHHTVGEGMYIGYTGGYKVFSNKICNGNYVFAHWLEGVDIHHNILENTGWDGIQVNLVRQDCKIHHNIITDWATANEFWQNFLMSIGGGVYEIYNNFSYNTPGLPGKGIQMMSCQSNSKFYNNVIINPDDHGLILHARHEYDDSTNGYYVLNNTIINPSKSGVLYNSRIVYSLDSNLIYFDQDNVPFICRNNLIANPGSDYGSMVNWREEAECFYDFNVPSTRDSQVVNIHHNVSTRDLDTIGVTDSLNNDYSPLDINSALYNTGFDVSVFNVNMDIDDIIRPQDLFYDIGAWEFVTLTNTKLREEEKLPLVYPNPFDDFIIIDNVGINQNVELMNLMGQIVFSSKILKNNRLDLRHLEPGIYLLNIYNFQQNLSKTSIIMKRSR
jgi:hypothetical protein